MKFNGQISGLKELDKTLSNLTKTTRRRCHQKSLRSGASIVKDSATANIRKQFNVHTGVLAKKSTIAIYNGKKYRGNYRVIVGIKRRLLNTMVKARNKATGAIENIRVGLYAAVGEYGSAKLNRRPRPWIRPAVRENVQTAGDAIRKEFSNNLADAVRDARK